MTLTEKISGLLKRIAASSRSSYAFAVSLAAILLAYRIQLTAGLFSSPVRPFDFNPGSHFLGMMLTFLPWDLALILGCFLMAWVFSLAPNLIDRFRIARWLNAAGLIFLNLAIFILLIIHAAHIRLLFDAQTGLDTAMIREVWLNIPVAELLKFIRIREALLLLLPLALFWLVLFLPPTLKRWAVGVSFLLVLLLPAVWVVAANQRTQTIPPEIRLNPPLFLFSDLADRALARYQEQNGKPTPLKEVHSALPQTDSLPSPSLKPVKWLPPRSSQPWNVVFIILESVGTRYAFDTGYAQPMPMPFLHQLTKEGWYLKNHYATSNISNKAIFSLLSGRYDLFNRETYGIKPEARVPSLYNFLEASHDSFIVTPSPITWYFPTAFIKNSGIPEIYSYDNLNLKIKEEYHSLGHYIGRDETQTVDFFIQRLNRAREPFLGIYLSFAAHLPYFDYGPEYRIREDDGRSINRYYNNLNLLDHMIRRIYDHLKEKGILERTLLVIAGDHGQAFGQHHPDNFMHYRYSYSENLEAPALLYQPAVFEPRRVDVPTHHVDLLPTLLDAMRVPYDPTLFNGESLFQNRPRRKYIFFYGYEETVSSLDTRERIKVQYSIKKNRCWAFDLKVDPEEKNPLDCSLYSAQLEDLRRFAHSHDAGLVQYSASMRGKQEGQREKGPTQ